MAIVTKQGDRGKTKLYSGEEVSKCDFRLEAYGTLDELVSFMGLARSFCEDSEIAKYILEKQEILFRLGTELATKDRSKVKVGPIDQKDVQDTDDLLVDLETKISLPRHFVIPGTNRAASFLDVSRTVCRRLERLLVKLSESGEWNNQEALIFVNRLSDLLFLMARKVEGKS